MEFLVLPTFAVGLSFATFWAWRTASRRYPIYILHAVMSLFYLHAYGKPGFWFLQSLTVVGGIVSLRWRRQYKAQVAHRYRQLEHAHCHICTHDPSALQIHHDS